MLKDRPSIGIFPVDLIFETACCANDRTFKWQACSPIFESDFHVFSSTGGWLVYRRRFGLRSFQKVSVSSTKLPLPYNLLGSFHANVSKRFDFFPPAPNPLIGDVTLDNERRYAFRTGPVFARVILLI